VITTTAYYQQFIADQKVSQACERTQQFIADQKVSQACERTHG